MKAHIIRDDKEAIAIAHKLAAEFATGDSERDQTRRLPAEEILRCWQLLPQWRLPPAPSLAVIAAFSTGVKLHQISFTS